MGPPSRAGPGGRGTLEVRDRVRAEEVTGSMLGPPPAPVASILALDWSSLWWAVAVAVVSALVATLLTVRLLRRWPARGTPPGGTPDAPEEPLPWGDRPAEGIPVGSSRR